MPSRFLELNANQIFVATTVLENALASIDAQATNRPPDLLRRVMADYIVNNISEDEDDIPELIDACVKHLKKRLWTSTDIEPQFYHHMIAA